MIQIYSRIRNYFLQPRFPHSSRQAGFQTGLIRLNEVCHRRGDTALVLVPFAVMKLHE